MPNECFGQNLPKMTLNKKVNTTTEFNILHLVLVSNFTLNKQFWVFDQNWPKTVFPVKNWKSQHHHWILDISISLNTKFQLKLTILIFWTKFAQKGYFWFKQKEWAHHRSLHIWIRLSTKFELKLKNSIFLDKIFPKRIFLV